MIFDGLMLMLLGVLAVPGLIIAKRPDAKQIIDKIAPYQGWIGALIAVWGVVRLISWLGMLGHLGAVGIVRFVVYTVFVFVSIALGFMLGIGVIKSFVKDPRAVAKMDQTLARLAPKQGMLGMLAIVDGALLIILSLIH